MRRNLMSFIVTLLAACITGVSVRAEPEAPFAKRSLTEIEQRQEAIDAELEQLAYLSLRSGIGAIGFRSRWHNTAEQTEWVEIELDQEYPVDEVVLVPVIKRISRKEFQAIGFPLALRIIAGTATDRTGVVVAEYGPADSILPRIAPVMMPAGGIWASWVRIEALQLPQEPFYERYILQLAEVMIFSGKRNVALRQPVKTSSTHPRVNTAWDKQFLVDGHTPYLMHAADGLRTDGYLAPPRTQPLCTLDLGEAVPISRIHLHALQEADTVPQSQSGDQGLPNHLRIEGASSADFSDAITLLDFRKESIYSTGPIMMWNLPETVCRYVRIQDVNPASDSRFGFAEIEIFSQGRNVALGKQVHAGSPSSRNKWRLPTLTDGCNRYGNILEPREWMRQLARRHDLELARPLVADELSRRYARQKTYLHRMIWLAALLAAGIGFTILIDRMIRMSHIAKIRERFAADLHDELGADLHCIGLLSDLAKDAKSDSQKLDELLQHIRVTTEEAGAAVRHCSRMQDGLPSGAGLREDLQRIAERIVVHLEHDLSIEGGAVLDQLKPRIRSDLFLFYKECLINICRHAGATRLSTRLTAGKKQICLTVSDNGHGFFDSSGLSRSLKRRARLMGARVTAEQPENGGTRITLRLRIRKI
jgi:signal transduction histidine kinase